MKTIMIVQRRLTHYRVPLFWSLRDELAKRNIRMKLLVGQGAFMEKLKKDEGDLSWSIKVPTRYIFGSQLCWQSVYRHLSGVSLVIITQENALLANYFLIFLPRKFKVAFWGHGANLQSPNPKGIREKIKRWMTTKVDWWFAYTQLSANIVVDSGFPSDSVTILNNSMETFSVKFNNSYPNIENVQRYADMNYGPIGVFVGSLYKNKRIDFVLAAAKMIRKEISDFNLLIIGEGEEHNKVRMWCDQNAWCKWVGERFGVEKAAYISTAKIMLNPGLVGLGILDSFACSVPMVTTDCGLHSPEIAYLENNVNGVITENNLNCYADTCIRLLRDHRTLEELRKGCEKSANTYTLEKMVNNFADGIELALSER